MILKIRVTIYLIVLVSISFSQNNEISDYKELFDQTLEFIEQDYVDSVSYSELIISSMKGLLEPLDPYTRVVIGSSKDKLDQMTKGKYGGVGINMSDLNSNIEKADIIIGGTEGVVNSITKESLKQKPIVSKKVFIDLGVPRNFDPEIKTIKGICLYDLDQLKELTTEGIQKRTSEIPKAINIIDQELNEFLEWYKLREVSPIISNYWKNSSNKR